MIDLINILNNNDQLVNNILSNTKSQFSSNENLINISIGLINELNTVISSLNSNTYILNKHFYKLIQPITTYSNKLLTDIKLINAYKLYDFFKIDWFCLKEYLNSILL